MITQQQMPPLNFPYTSIQIDQVLSVEQEVRLDARAAEQLRFRQVNPKEAFTLQDAEGRFFRASLKDLTAKGAHALVYEEMAHSPESPLELSLVCAVLARQRMLFVAQKATELGVTRLVPALSAHSVPAEGLEHEKAHAWPGQALRAARQCRRATVPEVREAIPLTGALREPYWQDAERRYYLDDRPEGVAVLERGAAAAVLAVGPEGGWSDEERELLRAADAQPLYLGGRVLRAETAVVSALTLVQYILGDLR